MSSWHSGLSEPLPGRARLACLPLARHALLIRRTLPECAARVALLAGCKGPTCPCDSRLRISLSQCTAETTMARVYGSDCLIGFPYRHGRMHASASDGGRYTEDGELRQAANDAWVLRLADARWRPVQVADGPVPRVRAGLCMSWQACGAAWRVSQPDALLLNVSMPACHRQTPARPDAAGALVASMWVQDRSVGSVRISSTACGGGRERQNGNAAPCKTQLRRQDHQFHTQHAAVSERMPGVARGGRCAWRPPRPWWAARCGWRPAGTRATSATAARSWRTCGRWTWPPGRGGRSSRRLGSLLQVRVPTTTRSAGVPP